MDSGFSARRSLPLPVGVLALLAGAIVLLAMMGVMPESRAYVLDPGIVPVAMLMVPAGWRGGGASLRLPAIIGFLAVLPFMVLEAVNRRGHGEAFPLPLFVLAWLLALMFMRILLPVVRDVRGGENILGNPVLLLARGALLVALAGVWVAVMADQMPCFLGMPSCD